jgi:hypothetical protein
MAGYLSLIYVAFSKPGPLGTLLGPTLAENRPQIKKKQNIYFRFLFWVQVSSAPPAVGPQGCGSHPRNCALALALYGPGTAGSSGSAYDGRSMNRTDRRKYGKGFDTETFYSMLRNGASGPEIGLPGRILAGLLPGL